jgi:pimeloyl-ACP methyl ester carboxylesterase
MKVAIKKIEILKSEHSDNKAERVPSIKNWQLKIAQWGFQTLGHVFPEILAEKAYDIFSTPRWRARHSRTDDIIDGAKVVDLPFREHIVKLYEWGKKGNPIIFLAHGWESRGTALRMFVPLLIEMGFQVVAFDALAHGDSSGERNNLTTNAQTIAVIIKHYGGIYGAICHSFGCSSIVYAQQHVDNSIKIEKLVFLAVPHKTKKIIDTYHDLFKVPTSIRTKFYKKVESISGLKIDEIDVATAYPHVKVTDLLLVHDRFDETTSLDAAEKVVHNWDNARLLITEGYGHFRLAKNPDVLKRIIAFIGEF